VAQTQGGQPVVGSGCARLPRQAACRQPIRHVEEDGSTKQVRRLVYDLSTVYSIGYRPTNKTLDGKWRNVEVLLINRPDLFARTKRGYYAKLRS
jgi:hypothetical protein